MNKRLTIVGVFWLLLGLAVVRSFFPTLAGAATLSNASDTITTSRPSASAPLSANQAASATFVSIIDNGSIFLASDAATLRPDTGESLNTVTIASMSAAIAGSPVTRLLFFTGTAANTHHAGDAIVAPMTAMHTIGFTTVTAVPVSGRITLTFPTLASGDANTPASPSATTFQMNGLSSSQIKVFSNTTDITSNLTIAVNNPSGGTSPTITLTLDGSTSIAAGTPVKIFLGCTAATSSSCSAQSPRIINPTKTAAAGTADTWALTILTTDITNSTDLDSVTVKIATIDSVRVQATVDPTLTFTIAGINNGVDIATNNTACTGNTDDTDSGYNASATFVNLGILTSAAINISAQDLTVSTNAQSGYTLTATASGQLINPANGYAISSSTTPSTMTAGTEEFGIHPCGTDTATGTWGSGAIEGGGSAMVAWPTATSALTLASRTGTANAIKTTVEYAATVSGVTPAGVYAAVITYVATATF